MKEEPKVPYELRQRSKHYVGLWQGKHCICSICTNTERGKLDAQFLLEACDGREALLDQREALRDACKALMDDISTMIQLVQNGHSLDSFNNDSYTQGVAAIAGSKT